MEQPKKPGPRDITDLKARLGLNKGAPPPGAQPPQNRGAFPGGPGAPGAPGPNAPVNTGAQPFFNQPPAGPPHPTQAPGPMPGQMPGQRPTPMPGQGFGGNAAVALDPYASLRPPEGRTFDLRPIEDAQPVANLKSGGFRTAIIIGVALGAVGLFVGGGFGTTVSARRAWNATNAAAKTVDTELQEMQKTITQIETAVTAGIQRASAAKADRLSYDPKVIEDLEKVRLDPRPDTSRIFRVDYARMSDLAVDNLMTYYYDAIALYNEVERHVKKSKADAASLAAFAQKQGEKGQANYGVVFAGGGKMVIANLVEMGQPVCKGGGTDCPVDQLEGFQIRGAAGSSWSTRKVGTKPDGSIVVPLDRTPLFESVMAGSPDQARMEQFRGRYANLQLLLARLKQTQKPLMDAVKAAASRPDMFSL
ncbi:MAG TPA: hypothetical protein VGG33_17735 [Polyangia bacterium]